MGNYNEHWLYDYVYRNNFYLLEPVTNKGIKQFIKNQFKIENYEPGPIGDGRCLDIRDGEENQQAVIICLKNRFSYTPKNISTLTHELLHAAHFVLSERHVNFKMEDNNESYTYYLEYLTREFIDVIKKNRAKAFGKRKKIGTKHD